MQDVIVKIAKLIDGASDIAVYCHTNPDGDAIGSMLALYSALKKQGKTVVAYCDTAIPSKYKWLTDCEFVTFPEKRTHEMAISVDCGDLDRLGYAMRSYLSARTKIAIDHHKTFKKFAQYNLYDTNSSSCCEIVFELLQHMNLLDKEIAQSLFCGIVTDTSCFSLSSVNKHTFEVASKLVDFGINAQKIIYDAYRSTSINRFKLKSAGMTNTRFYCDNKVAIIKFLNKDFESTSTESIDSVGMVNELIDIDSVVVAYSLSQVGDRNFQLSVRTKGDVDAVEIVSYFGGGGHKNAAGCRVNGYIEDIEENLIKMASDRL